MIASSRKNLIGAGCVALALTLLFATVAFAQIFLTKVQTIKDGVDGLDAPFAITISPDGKFAYVAAMQDNGIAVFERNATTGVLTPTQFVQDGVGSVVLGTLTGPTTVALSPNDNGKHVYVGGTGSAVAVFERNTTTGELAFVEAKMNGVGDVLAFLFFGISGVTLDPNGGSVYVASTGNASGSIPGAVAVFSRNATTGELTFVEAKKDGVGDVPDGLFGASSVTVSPDENFVYVTSSLDRMGRGDNSLLMFTRATSGTLSYLDSYKDSNVLYGISAAVMTGTHFYATGGGNPLLGKPGTVAMFTQEVSGTLTLTEVYTDDVGGVDGLNKALGIAISPAGDNIYVAGKEDDAVAVFARNVPTGTLTFLQALKDGGGIDGLDAALAVAVSPDGEHVYALGEYDDAVALFDRNETTGALTFVEAYRGSLVDINGLNGATSVGVSPDGKYVYATGMYDGAVAAFRRDETSGQLTFVEFHRDGVSGVDGLAGAYAIALSPNDNGMHVYVASYYDNALAAFSRSAATGVLTFVAAYTDGVNGIDGLYGANSVTLSPDGKHVYTTGMYDSAVAVFSRNETTGALTFVEMQKDGVGGVDGLAYARAVAVSPDGKHVYAVGFLDNAVAVFSRDDTAGTLTYVGIVTNVDGLSGPEWVTVSPDGKHVYVACLQSKAVIVFRRDETTGVLTFVEVHKDDTAAPTPGTADGLDGAKSVVVSPNGKYVYVVGQGLDQALVVFSRDSATGKLTYHEVFKDDLFGGTIDGLNTPMNVTVSPDSEHLYIASKVDDAVVVFSNNDVSFAKSVTLQSPVSYGDMLTYTLVLSHTAGTQVGLYDPLEGTTFSHFVEQPAGVEHVNNVITGTLTVTPTNQITISFVAQVATAGTAGILDITNRACVYPSGGTINNCAWSNEVTNRTYRIYLPVVFRNS